MASESHNSLPGAPQAQTSQSCEYVNPKAKVESNIQEFRVAELSKTLSGKSFTHDDIITFDYPDQNGREKEMNFDIKNQIITVKEMGWSEKRYKLTLPDDATISEVSFHNEWIKLTGKVGWFSWSGEAKYGDLMNALDKVISSGQANIALADGKSISLRLA